MSEIQVDNAAATTATEDKDAVSPAELDDGLQDEEQVDADLLSEEPEGKKPDEEEDPDVIRTQATQKRFDDLTGRIAEQESELERLRARSQPLDVSGLSEPKPDDYEDGEDDRKYIADRGAWQGATQALKIVSDSQERQQQDDVVNTAQRKVDSYVQKTVKVKEDVKDFEAVVRATELQAVDGQGNFTPSTLAILEADNGPQVAYHIASNPELARTLNRATPIQAAIAIGKISAQLSVRPAKVKEKPGPIESEDTGSGPGKAADGYEHLGKAKFY